MIIFLLSLLGVILIFLLIYFLGEGLGDLKTARKEFKIFGLSEGFTPQGLCFMKNLDCFLISGYMKNKKLASRIYVIDAKNKSLVKYFCLKDKKTEICGHFGGVTSFGDDVWISSDGEVFRINANQIKNAKNCEKIQIIDKFSSNNGADFCFVYAGTLWIGEFYKLGKFETETSHHVSSTDGEQFHSMCFGFKISKQGECAIESKLPEIALSIPDLVQGICVTGDELFLSCSYGISKSSILIYKNIFSKSPNRFTVFGEKQIPLLILTKENFKQKLSLPSMSEGIDDFDGRLYILFENAAKKYRIFTRRKLKNIFSISLNKN